MMGGPTRFVIRPEEPRDYSAIRSVLESAFVGGIEWRLVDLLRDAGSLILGLVAECDGYVIGHIAFSPVSVLGSTCGVGLAPVAVQQDWQRQKVGSALIEAGLEKLRAVGVPAVFVLGEPDYYGRFGFVPASRCGLSCVFGGGDGFQVMPLVDGGLPRAPATVEYSGEFKLFD